ncbi:MAG: DNA primase [Spirochaetes bacterium]|nr:DNA primase [Spirochaetota bacterium]
MSIPRETIELVRERAQIEEIIKRYVPDLKKNGNNLTALCPFHKEKTPSFSVSPDKQMFYCFGCHAGGNVFSFISKIEGLTFPESVKFVGDLVGIKVENKPDAKSGGKEYKSDTLREINRYAMEFYHKLIFAGQGKAGLDYILKRGTEQESIKEFKLGFSPDSWSALVNHLKAKKVPPGLSFELGLAGSKDKQNYYDRFRNRVMFPIINHRNEVVGFGGRAIDGTEPKYLNSQESAIFKKREVLYGLNIAKTHISEYKRAIVVEGYLDVIGCHQAGIKNTVAPLGTALTLEQLKLLSRYCKEVILLFDADSAGIKASLRSIELFKNVNLEVKIAVLPQYDPFEFIIKKGIREFMVVVDKALNPVDYQILRVVEDKKKNNDKLNVLLEIFRIIRNIEYETEQQKYLQKVSVMLSIPENTVRTDFTKYLKKQNKQIKGISAGNLTSGEIDFLIKSYQEMVILLCNFPELIDHARMDLDINEFPDPVSKNIFTKLTELYSKNEKISIDKIYDYFPDGEEKFLLEKNYCSIEDPESAYNDYTKRYIRIRVEQIDKKIDYYKNIIDNPGSLTGKDLNDCLVEYQIWQREKDKLSSHL